MGRGKQCPDCKHPMKVAKEENQPMGNWVVYQCKNYNCKSKHSEKVFEESREVQWRREKDHKEMQLKIRQKMNKKSDQDKDRRR